MDTFQRLNDLSSEVKRTFQSSFIFLVHPDKVQHFPAREWTRDQFLEALNTRLGPDYVLEKWENMVIAIAKDKNLIAILPKYSAISSIKEA